MKHLRQLILALFLLAGLSLTAQTEYKLNNKANGFSIGSRSTTATTIIHNISSITIEEADRNGMEGQFITLSGIHIANEAGAPNLPSSSAFLAIPNGAKPFIKLVNAKTKTLNNIDLIPAPQPQLDNDNSPAVYQKDMNIYGRNAFYPATPYNISEVMTVRGVEMVQIGVMPFQYNPVTKELIVYEDLELELTTEGGDGTFGDNRYRTPEWDQILNDMLLNREVLPEVDYGEKLRKHYQKRETGCEYIIITPDNDDFIQLADTIRQFRIQQGIPTEIFTVTQCGGNTGQAIRNFIRSAYNSWDMPPAAVLILGDHDTDPTKGIVSYTMNNHPGGDGYNPYISDHKYAVMGNNHMPDIIVGRITGRNYDELYHMIKKDIDYERTPPTNPDFYDKPVTAMGFQLERWFQLCSEVVNGFWEYELGKHPVRINAIYEGHPGSLWSTADNTNTVVNYFGPNGCGYIPNNMSHLTEWNGSGNDINNAINNGAFLLQHRDHGAEEVWGEPSYGTGYIKRLTNDDLTYVMSNNCLTGRFNYGGTNSDGCFAEVFHRHQHGALGLIAATQVSYSFVNDVYVWGSYDNMWPDFMPTYGTQHATNFLLPAFGNAAGKYFLKQSSWTDDYVKEITYYLFHQHGDAYMNLYSEMPQNLDVEMLPVLVAGSDKYQLKVDEGATICLTVNGQIIGFDYGTGNIQEVTVTPQVPGTTVLLTIKKQNYYRYEHKLTTIPAEGPYLVFNALQINDEEGNGNQSTDYNETCHLNVSLHNVGSESIGNIATRLSCPNPNVEIIQGETTYGNIGSDQILNVNDAFTIHLGDAFEDGEKVRLFLNMQSGDHTFNDSIDLIINAPVLNYTLLTLTNPNGEPTDRLLKGASTLMTFDITNSGHSKSLEVANALEIKVPFLDITESTITSPEIEAGTTAQVTFQVNLHDDAPFGNVLNYTINAESGWHTAHQENTIPLGFTIEDFDDNTLNPLLNWHLGSGNKKWYITEDETATGGFCIQSPSIEQNQKANLTMGITCPIEDKFSFNYTISTGSHEELQLHVNNTLVATWSGDNDWERSEFMLKEGTNLIKFTYIKDSQSNSSDDFAKLDEFHVPPFEELYLFAGDNNEGCPDTPFTPNSCILYPKEILWTTNGDGTFNNPTLERPTYTFGENDITNGQVTLNVTASSDKETQSQQITVNLLETISLVPSEIPTGDTLVDLRLTTQNEYFVVENTPYTIAWSLEPEQAGELTSNGTHVIIIWNNQFKGFASLSYRYSNLCGESEASEALSIHVINATEADDNNATAFQVYPNPAKDKISIKANGIPSGQVVIRIIDRTGRLVYEAVSNVMDDTFETQLNIQGLSSGLYDIQLIDKEITHNTRLMVY